MLPANETPTRQCRYRFGAYCLFHAFDAAMKSARRKLLDGDAAECETPPFDAVLAGVASALAAAEAGGEHSQCRALQGLPCRNEREKPEYDKDDRVLRYQGKIVKQFTGPADNQEIVLTAFEEAGWPERIDDPIPPHSGVNPKKCLRFTIERLNKHQKNSLLHFSGDGTGEGVRWAVVVETGNPIEVPRTL